MPRPLRDQTPGAIHHVTTRQNLRRRLYRDDGDRESFLAIVQLVIDRCRWDLYAYCLMTTHYHLLFRTRKPDLAYGMQLINGLYAASYNKKYAENTHVFGHRYASKRVKDSAHFASAVVYIAFNPVREGLCEQPEDWPWSSYGATARTMPLADMPEL